MTQEEYETISEMLEKEKEAIERSFEKFIDYIKSLRENNG